MNGIPVVYKVAATDYNVVSVYRNRKILNMYRVSKLLRGVAFCPFCIALQFYIYFLSLHFACIRVFLHNQKSFFSLSALQSYYITFIYIVRIWKWKKCMSIRSRWYNLLINKWVTKLRNKGYKYLTPVVYCGIRNIAATVSFLIAVLYLVKYFHYKNRTSDI